LKKYFYELKIYLVLHGVDRVNYFSLSASFIKFSDLIDILIVSYGIYKIMSWIKETRAWSLFKGLVVILIIFALSSLFSFSTLYWVISNTFNVGLVAVIVLFQPELRKALEQLGKKKFINSFIKSENIFGLVSEKTIQEIIKAVENLARTKTGALIVLEKEVPLGDFEQTGIIIDAVISSQLLINIFVNKTPLHDGAVIIRNNKIKAATCILPLSQNVTKHEFGTRHRAAIGASEVSDSYVLVVSEERGEISVAHNGKLYKNLDHKAICDILFKINLAPKEKKNNS